MGTGQNEWDRPTLDIPSLSIHVKFDRDLMGNFVGKLVQENASGLPRRKRNSRRNTLMDVGML